MKLVKKNDMTIQPSKTYCQAASTTSSQATSDSKSGMNMINNSMTQLTVLSTTNSTTNATQLIQPVADSIIPVIDTSTAELTTSTMTSDDNGKLVQIQSNLITKLVDQQLSEYTTAMNKKYENAIKSIQLSHSNQISEIANKQQLQEKDINDLRITQTTIKHDIEKQIKDKVESQTNILNSIVTLVQDLKADNEHKHDGMPDKRPTREMREPSPKVSQNELTDCSYSESSSSQCSVASTTPNFSSSEVGEKQECNKNKMETEIPTNDKIVNSDSNAKCKRHENKIDDSTDNDIRQRTRSQFPSADAKDNDCWKGITSKTKRSTKHHLAIISPSKQTSSKVKYDATSSKYNRYDPEGLIVNNTPSKTPSKDHPVDQKRVLRSGRKI
jgi:hypothetical protein